MVIIHYAGITNNNASGVSVVVPQIINSMSTFEDVALYNYANETVNIKVPAIQIDNQIYSDDYHRFPVPFSKPDIVIFHSPFGIPKMKNLISILINDNIPYVIVPHGCFSKAAMKKKRLKKWLAIKLFFNKALKHAAAIQYLCENEMEDSIFKLSHIIVSNGIGIPNQIPREYTTIKQLTFIGRKDLYHKGIDVLLEGCALIKDELAQNDIKIVLYGPGSNEQESEINQIITANNLTDIVKSRPGVFGTEKIDVLKKTDIFLLTSRYEGQPIAVLEAMAYSLPVLITPGTGFSEEVKEHNCGKVVEFSVQDIANGILSMINDKAFLKKASQNAYSYVSEEYCWENVTKRALTEYKGVCYEKDSRI